MKLAACEALLAASIIGIVRVFYGPMPAEKFLPLLVCVWLMVVTGVEMVKDAFRR